MHAAIPPNPPRPRRLWRVNERWRRDGDPDLASTLGKTPSGPGRAPRAFFLEMAMPPAFIAGPRVVLRPREVEEAEFYQAGISRPEIRAFLAVYGPITLCAERAWLEDASRPKDVFGFTIALREGGRPIGGCELRCGPSPHRTADLGIALFEEEFLGRGYGADAVKLLLEYGFDTLNLHRIELKVYANNPRAARCYEKCGFRREGSFREARWWAGRWWDVHLYGLLDPEWRTLNERGAVT
jgi:RimJ/RimL family protein N-acetyltransferase